MGGDFPRGMTQELDFPQWRMLDRQGESGLVEKTEFERQNVGGLGWLSSFGMI